MERKWRHWEQGDRGKAAGRMGPKREEMDAKIEERDGVAARGCALESLPAALDGGSATQRAHQSKAHAASALLQSALLFSDILSLSASAIPPSAPSIASSLLSSSCSSLSLSLQCSLYAPMLQFALFCFS